VRAAAAEKGVALPGSVGAVPDVSPVALPYWRAFEMVSSRRPWIAGPGGIAPHAIAVSEIRAVAPLWGFEDRDREFVEVLLDMDATYLSAYFDARQQR